MKAGTVGEGTIGSNAAGMNAIPAFGSNQSNANSPNHRLEQAQKVAVVCQIIVAGVCISFALYFLEPVLVPLVLATFFSQAMQPLLAFLTQRTRLPSSIAVFFAMLTLCGSFIAVIFATIHRCASAPTPLLHRYKLRNCVLSHHARFPKLSLFDSAVFEALSRMRGSMNRTWWHWHVK